MVRFGIVLALVLTAPSAQGQCIDYAEGTPAAFGSVPVAAPFDIEGRWQPRLYCRRRERLSRGQRRRSEPSPGKTVPRPFREQQGARRGGIRRLRLRGVRERGPGRSGSEGQTSPPSRGYRPHRGPGGRGRGIRLLRLRGPRLRGPGHAYRGSCTTRPRFQPFPCRTRCGEWRRPGTTSSHWPRVSGSSMSRRRMPPPF